MDPIITKLNQVANVNIKNLPGNQEAPQSEGFQNTLNQSMADRVLEKYNAENSPQSNLNVISADNIHVTTVSPEMGKQTPGMTDNLTGALKEMNHDYNNVDSIIDTLSQPGVKLSSRDLLRVQVKMQDFTIITEGMSKITDSVTNGIKTIVQTQIS